MLTVTRKEDEQIVITDEAGIVIVKIEVKQIRRNQVRIGVEAPRNLTIARGELHDKSERSNP